MKILMLTNTYKPIVGGVEESISNITAGLQAKGHEVFIVAPDFKDIPKEEKGIIRIAAIKNFNNTDWSVNLPITGELRNFVEEFQPDIIHSHHPFLLGDVALRLAKEFKTPLIFTYHTMYEQYIHYLPIQNDLVKYFVKELASGYANLTSQVIAPSESVRSILIERSVETPIDVIPTGIDVDAFSKGSAKQFRELWNIPPQAFVVGHLGRLTPEKNVEALARSVCHFIKENDQAYFLVVGKGLSKEKIVQIFKNDHLENRLILTGILQGQQRIDSYHAMDVFVFASESETQGLVLTEAMAASVPIVAVDANGTREVVQDKVNGRLLHQFDQGDFVDALTWMKNQSVQRMEEIKREAFQTAEKFSKENTLKSLIEVYQKMKNVEFKEDQTKRYMWEKLKDRLIAEGQILRNMYEAGEAAVIKTVIDDRYLIKSNVKPRIVELRRFFKNREWVRKLLKLSKHDEERNSPGLVMIQIDGLSMNQLKKAIKNNKLSFLEQLLEKEHYKLYPLYTGLPSSTPSVQGELFYGVKQIVPAFSYYDKEAKKVLLMYDAKDANQIEKRLSKQAEGLLAGGSSYSNVFRGGAAEAHFCAPSLGFNYFWKDFHPIRIVIIILCHIFLCLRIIVLVVFELLLACFDFIIGMIRGESLVKESKFIPTRAIICILLRELVALGARLDIVRGLPIIHMNFLGYDEQAHRRGPSSDFAHNALNGIDATIAGIYKEALNATRRNYDVWIYSDHGQEDVDSYIEKYGRSVKQAVIDVFKNLGLESIEQTYQGGVQHQRARYLGSKIKQKMFGESNAKEDVGEKIIVTAIGPTGNIYLPIELNENQKDLFAKKLVKEAHIPLVVAPLEEGRAAKVWKEGAVLRLPEDAALIFGDKHPYLKELTQDLIDMANHPHAGSFTFCGWDIEKGALSFPVENGAHAGFGVQETNAFALMPLDIDIKPSDQPFIKTMDLRNAALRFLGRSQKEGISTPTVQQNYHPHKNKLRMMTYNVHSCIGQDGKASVENIARVIARHKPDIVALQELDMIRTRTGAMDQVHIIAKHLEMKYYFHPVVAVEEGQYGNAILSFYPMKKIKAQSLGSVYEKSKGESRGALWVKIQLENGEALNIVNTHLGLKAAERKEQIDQLLGADWIKSELEHGHVILTGDFNASRNSYVYSAVSKYLTDAQLAVKHHQPQATWSSRFPLRRIDHIFISSGFKVDHAYVSGSSLERVASDHLPLIVDLYCVENGENLVRDK